MRYTKFTIWPAIGSDSAKSRPDSSWRKYSRSGNRGRPASWHKLCEHRGVGGGAFGSRPVEGSRVRSRWAPVAADLADVLQGGGRHLVLGGGRLSIPQCLDAPAHALSLSGRATQVWPVQDRAD